MSDSPAPGAARPSACCAIDFGTSNSAVVLVEPRVAAAGPAGLRLVELEPGQPTMPTAVFYFADGPEHDGPPRAYGRAAIAAYVDGLEGRLMRSMKSILGSSLAEQRTEVGGGRAASYLEVIAGYLKRLRQQAGEALGAAAGAGPERVVLGRPVYFVDDDPLRDARAQSMLADAARAVGFREVAFQFEPIAAAFDYEQGCRDEQTVLVSDIGGGTSDFSVVRVGPRRAARLDRRDDILASHGVHVAGTDFDRQIELAAILPEFGFRALGPGGPGAPPREVPSAVYFDLATWHLINTVYTPARSAELRAMRRYYADARQHRRLMSVVDERLGHELIARAEQAKIETAEGADTRIDLSIVEPGLQPLLSGRDAWEALESDVERIVGAAVRTVADAGLAAGSIDALYFTGGSTGLQPLAERIAARFASARVVRGDRYASVARGLGLHAQRLFAG